MQCGYCQALNDEHEARCVQCGRRLRVSLSEPAKVADREPQVALPAKRMLAAAFDASMVLIALGLFVAVFFFSGGGLVFSRQTGQFLAAVLLLLGLFYQFLWVFANRDTPGMRFAGLRVVDFQGRSPDRERRGLRQAASLLSILSAGIGLLWALVDKRRMAWHDRLSKTFPTSA
jgi:uncharacterized RDD family membrane protein YckC